LVNEMKNTDYYWIRPEKPGRFPWLALLLTVLIVGGIGAGIYFMISGSQGTSETIDGRTIEELTFDEIEALPPDEQELVVKGYIEGRYDDIEKFTSDEQALLVEKYIEYQLMDVPEDYFGTVNELITLEQLKSSNLVTRLDIYYESSHYGYANLDLYGKVIDRNVEARTLVLENEGDTLEIYIGSNTWLRAPGAWIRFEHIGGGLTVFISCRFQFGRGDPLIPYQLYLE